MIRVLLLAQWRYGVIEAANFDAPVSGSFLPDQYGRLHLMQMFVLDSQVQQDAPHFLSARPGNPQGGFVSACLTGKGKDHVMGSFEVLREFAEPAAPFLPDADSLQRVVKSQGCPGFCDGLCMKTGRQGAPETQNEQSEQSPAHQYFFGSNAPSDRYFPIWRSRADVSGVEFEAPLKYMQNIDFSNRVRRGALRMPDEVVAVASVDTAPASDLKRRNRYFVLVLALLIFAFTIGLMAGIPLGKMQAMDSSVVRELDQPPAGQSDPARVVSQGGATGFSNTAETGRYLIKVGTFRPDDAIRMAAMLNNMPRFETIERHRCRNFNEAVPDRYPAFRVATSDGTERENVLLGCFLDREAGQRSLQVLLSSGIPGVSGSRLQEIVD